MLFSLTKKNKILSNDRHRKEGPVSVLRFQRMRRRWGRNGDDALAVSGRDAELPAVWEGTSEFETKNDQRKKQDGFLTEQEKS